MFIQTLLSFINPIGHGLLELRSSTGGRGYYSPTGVYKCINAGTGRAGKKLGMSGRKLDERETRGVGSFVSPEVQHIVHLIYLI